MSLKLEHYIFVNVEHDQYCANIKKHEQTTKARRSKEHCLSYVKSTQLLPNRVQSWLIFQVSPSLSLHIINTTGYDTEMDVS